MFLSHTNTNTFGDGRHIVKTNGDTQVNGIFTGFWWGGGVMVHKKTHLSYDFHWLNGRSAQPVVRQPAKVTGGGNVVLVASRRSDLSGHKQSNLAAPMLAHLPNAMFVCCPEEDQ